MAKKKTVRKRSRKKAAKKELRKGLRQRREALISLQRAAELTGMSYDTIYRRVLNGEIAHTTYEGVGGRLYRLVTVGELRRYRQELLRRYRSLGSPFHQEKLEEIENATE